MSHDESLNVYYSYNRICAAICDHTPLMHGPILSTTAFFYALFGDKTSPDASSAAHARHRDGDDALLFRLAGTMGTILARSCC